MTLASRRDLLRTVHSRYHKATRPEKSRILDELCATTGYHRKYAVWLLARPLAERTAAKPRTRPPTYSTVAIRVLKAIWEAAGYPWSQRLKALLPTWLPHARKHIPELTPEIERQLFAMSERTMDRRLQPHKRALRRRLYGRTKPGTLLKHHIPIKTDCWNVTVPGFVEIDLVSSSGNNASGDFIQSLNTTDILTTWTETRPVMSKGERAVFEALKQIQAALPFELRGIDSDNGAEFINHHLYRYCQQQNIQFTRGRPYKKDDNAHIEQKNWTHVRKLLGWQRYDSPEALEAIQGLFQNELSQMMNLFQTSVKLIKKVRVGSRLKRVYDAARTPLDRLAACGQGKPDQVAKLQRLREQLDPFLLAEIIDRKLERIYSLANCSQRPTGAF